MALSGIGWVSQFPTSTSINDLDSSFRPKVQAFADALATAGANVTVTASRRPRQRAYLMHYCWTIWKHLTNPSHVPAFVPMAGEAKVDIEWLHTTPDGSPNVPASRAAAAAMVQAYAMTGLHVAPALNSNHIAGKALDMAVTWTGTLSVKDKAGHAVSIATTPRDSTNAKLIEVGKTYGVIHFINVMKDKPHWSVNGH